ncbi:S-methyl-5'-thioadenosine phosphorylase [Prochlorococcus marinus]|uniref:S-methyl-5'-thioadenosine phosphorylase n=1 Tax=Prochlorococcus marinus XMU1408 TaxID=2213228 RepID=A0A318R1A9_PROMR|nr:S-methyl-5'-thioadenosine phosphorylase [Prochlorococcus marinus]MBW3041358.1 S-methyl-5'-thioadenosine phosphorylase [Prochlorococcus marinus str. XMU1408]PYE03257.1 S-methyl-5'-thioadenosine phosphorylase [Prochlorococcus marinus XMU1408]
MITQHDFLNISESQPDTYDLKKARLGIIGGSGLYRIDNLENVIELSLDTPYGKPSNNLLIGNLFGIEVVFLARHGENHTLNPSEIPYKANIWALRSLNVRWLISVSAVGSLKENIKPCDIVIPDQFIDRTHQRPLTFFTNGVVAHISMANPFCEIVSEILSKEIGKLLTKEKKLHVGGTYLAMEGPAFSTRAESKLYRDWGCSIIGMTNHTEARLAKEAEISYSSLSMVTDYDCWKQNCESVSVEMVIDNLKENASFAKSIISAAAKRISLSRPSSSFHNSLKDALVTPKEHVPETTKSRIQLFTNKYWL